MMVYHSVCADYINDEFMSINDCRAFECLMKKTTLMAHSRKLCIVNRKICLNSSAVVAFLQMNLFILCNAY